MSALREMQITLPADLAERVRDKMQSGRYASENEVIAESLAALEDRETEIENWLANDVKPAFDRWAADPKRSIPSMRPSQASSDEFRGANDLPCSSSV